MDPDGLGTPFVTNVNVVSVPKVDIVDDLGDLETAAPAEVELGTDAEQRGEPERVERPVGEALRIEYDLAEAARSSSTTSSTARRSGP